MRLAWVALMGLLTACGADPAAQEEPPGDSTTGGPSPLPAGSWGLGECALCVAQACSSAYADCHADPECPAYLGCLEACVGDVLDPACAAACPRGQTSESQRGTTAVDTCRTAGLGTACMACGTVPADPLPPVPSLYQDCPAPSLETRGCFACQDRFCCETYEACQADPECVAYKACIREHGDFAAECVEQHPAGVAVQLPNFLCGIYHCAIDTPDCDPSQRDPCLACAYGPCFAQYAAFEGTVDGFLLGNCIGACPEGDDACDQACYDAHPFSVAAAQAFGECVLVNCPEC